MDILKIGTKVKFGPEDAYKGEISAALIREHTVLYEVSFWKESELKSIWLLEKNFKTTAHKTNTIGFSNGL